MPVDRPRTDEPPATPDTPAADPPFDPYAISAVAILINEGRAALQSRLAAIARAEDLRAFAKAQRLTLDPPLAADAAPDTLRAALLAAAERRVASRDSASG
ncbi:MAG: hypothetical protein R3D33_09335 [Hyphomicrobiaceae bacterium]